MKINDEVLILGFACVFLCCISISTVFTGTESPLMTLDIIALISLLFSADTEGKIITTLPIVIAVLAQLRALLPTLLIKKLPKPVVALVDWLVGNYGSSKNLYH